MKTRLLLVGFGSLIYAVTIVWGGTWLFFRLQSLPSPLPAEADTLVLTLQTVIAFLPFGILLFYVAFKLKGEITPNAQQRIARAASTGLVCSLALWGLYYYAGMSGEGGANLGLGFLMLISPILIFCAMRWVFKRSTNRNV